MTQVIKHRPKNITIETNLQTVHTQCIGSIEIGQIHLFQGVQFFGAKVHGTQCLLIPLCQTAHGVQQHGGGEVGFLIG